MHSCVKDSSAFEKTFIKSLQTLHESNPVVTRVEQLLDPDECSYIIKLADEAGCARSTVVNNNSGEKKTSNARTSSTCHIPKAKDKIVHCIERKIAAVAQQPYEDLESLQVTRYIKSQEYKPHHDWFHNTRAQNTQRSATVFTYLKNLNHNCGGATAFPKLKNKHGKILKSYPQLGDAIIWRNLTHMGVTEDYTLHAGEPVTCDDEKIGLNAWFGSDAYISQNNQTYNILVFFVFVLLVVILMNFVVIR